MATTGGGGDDDDDGGEERGDNVAMAGGGDAGDAGDDGGDAGDGGDGSGGGGPAKRGGGGPAKRQIALQHNNLTKATKAREERHVQPLVALQLATQLEPQQL